MDLRGSNQLKKVLEDINKEEYETVVVRNLRPDTGNGNIAGELEALGFRVHDIRNAVDIITKHPVPLFFLKLKKTPWNERIYRLKYIAQQEVKVERFQEPKKVLRCTKCQELGHCIADCTGFPVCGYCSGPHLTRNCSFGRDVTPTCSRCRGAHPSSYKGCLVYKKQVKEIEKAMSDNEQASSSQASSEDLKLEGMESLTEFEDALVIPFNFLPPPNFTEQEAHYAIYELIEMFSKNVENFYSNNKEAIKIFFQE